MARMAAISAGDAVEVQPPALGRADAVLGADAAAPLGDEAQHGVVDPLVVGVDAGDVDVDVAVADVAEQPGPRVRGDGARPRAGTSSRNAASVGRRAG